MLVIMNIKSIHSSPGSRYYREMVYSCTNSLKEYQAFKDSPLDKKFDDLLDMLPDRSKASDYQTNEMAKVAIIHQRYQRTLNLLIKLGNNLDLLTQKNTSPRGATIHNTAVCNF